MPFQPSGIRLGAFRACRLRFAAAINFGFRTYGLMFLPGTA